MALKLHISSYMCRIELALMSSESQELEVVDVLQWSRCINSDLIKRTLKMSKTVQKIAFSLTVLFR